MLAILGSRGEAAGKANKKVGGWVGKALEGRAMKSALSMPQACTYVGEGLMLSPREA